MNKLVLEFLNFIYINPTFPISFVAVIVSILSFCKSKESLKLVKSKEENEALRRKNQIIHEKIISIENALEAYDKIKDKYDQKIVATPEQIKIFQQQISQIIDLIYYARKQSLIIYAAPFEINQFRTFNINLINEYKKYMEFETKRLEKSNLSVTEEHPDYKESLQKIYTLHESINAVVYFLMETSRHLTKMLMEKESKLSSDYINGVKMIMDYDNTRTTEETLTFIKEYTKIKDKT